MFENRRRFLATVAASIAVAGCQDDGGDDGSTGTPTEASTPETASTPADATVSVREHDDLGEILVDAEGLTLYMFDSDTRGAGESTCTGGCLDAWPPLTVADDPVSGDGVEAELTTFERDDGEAQIAANGWPLYYYSSDAEPGDATGQGANDVWWVLDAAGEPIRSASVTESES